LVAASVFNPSLFQSRAAARASLNLEWVFKSARGGA